MPIPFSQKFSLQKQTWTQDDFEAMGWHDVWIHAVTSEPEEFEFILDIDYIFAWVDPEPPSEYFSFWIAPATLVFKNVWNFKADLGDSLELQLLDISRKNPQTPKNSNYSGYTTEWTWELELEQGRVAFSASAYSLYTRAVPVRHSSQYFSKAERGGISFDRIGD